MIQIEKINENFVKTYSDSDYKIRQIETGRIYINAVDRLPLKYTYEETDIEIEQKNKNNLLINKYEEIIDIITEGKEVNTE